MTSRTGYVSSKSVPWCRTRGVERVVSNACRAGSGAGGSLSPGQRGVAPAEGFVVGEESFAPGFLKWEDEKMGMREECKHFQSRTYDSGEAARFCVLGNAPDQPWSCPENCITFERRFADVGWAHGSLVKKPVEKAPNSDVPLDDRRELLDQASEIVNAVAPELFEQRRRELDELEERRRRGWKFWRR